MVPNDPSEEGTHIYCWAVQAEDTLHIFGVAPLALAFSVKVVAGKNATGNFIIMGYASADSIFRYKLSDTLSKTLVVPIQIDNSVQQTAY